MGTDRLWQFLYGTEEDQLVRIGLPLLYNQGFVVRHRSLGTRLPQRGNLVLKLKTLVNTGRRHCMKRKKLFHQQYKKLFTKHTALPLKKMRGSEKQNQVLNQKLHQSSLRHNCLSKTVPLLLENSLLLMLPPPPPQTKKNMFFFSSFFYTPK